MSSENHNKTNLTNNGKDQNGDGDIYVPTLELNEVNDQVKELINEFKKNYLIQPTFIARVPGRVNLIGEHIDYCGYPVLPMAVEQCIYVAAALSADDVLTLKNVNPKYKPFKTSVSDIQIDLPNSGGPEWYKYFLCGVKGIFEHIGIKNGDNKGFFVAVSGNIPPAAGLSSSSALVSAAVLATAYLHKVPLIKEKLATIAAQCERYIGTQGGGMDQAIAFLAKQGCAQYIEWNPLRATSVQLPQNAIFVIANSLTEANKAATHDFNQRVVECRLGCKLMAKYLGLDWREVDRFATLQTRLGCSHEDLIKHTEKYLTESLYRREEVCQKFGITDTELSESLLSKNTQHLQEFKIRQRTLHVFQEALRVEEFRRVACKGESNSLKTLCRLMDSSHQSLDELYECSHENLNKICEIGRNCGVGIRLTGAGWGGCVVALCDSIAAVDTFINQLKEHYYNKLDEKTRPDSFETTVFATSPQRGAEVYVLKSGSS